MNTDVKNSPETVLQFLLKEGIGDQVCHKAWFKNNLVLVNGKSASREDRLSIGDILSVRGRDYHIMPTADETRLFYDVAPIDPKKAISGKIRVQAGYHKCLTMYFRRVSRRTVKWQNPFGGSFRHFFHRVDEFYDDCQDYTISSISGHYLDLDRFEDIKAVHIIRDPRDMVVSGYFYHKRAAESWCDYLNPTDKEWGVVNAPVSGSLPKDTSLTEYINSASVEDGLRAEIEFRQFHFENMMKWPVDDPRVLTVKYEDVIGNEAETFGKIYDFYGFGPHVKFAAKHYADRYSSKSQRRDKGHIRNPNAGQWQDLFTPELKELFTDKYGSLLSKYGYE